MNVDSVKFSDLKFDDGINIFSLIHRYLTKINRISDQMFTVQEGSFGMICIALFSEE